VEANDGRDRASDVARGKLIRVLWELVVLYAAGRVCQALPDRVPMLVTVVLHVVPAAAFAWIHRVRRYGARTMAVFTVICLGVGNLFENVGVLTGFPFGHYHFTEVMGPRVFQVPVLLGLAYLGMGYLSWTLATILVGSRPRFGLAMTAALIMVAWDVCMDPVWATMLRAWVWHDGGAWFGVPLSNYFGWLLTVVTFYSGFALYLFVQKTPAPELPISETKLALVFYGISAVGNLFVAGAPSAATVADATGATWQVRNIMAASALTSVFTMGLIALLAWRQFTNHLQTSQNRS